MAEITIFISVFTIIFLILFQKLNIRFTIAEDRVIKIDYSLFELTLAKEKSGASNSKMAKKKRNPIIFASFKRALTYLIKGSDVDLHLISVSAENSEPHKFTVIYQSFISLFSAFAMLIAENAKSFTFDDEKLIFTTNQQTPLLIDISTSCRLYRPTVALLIFSVRFMTDTVGSKIKKMKKRNGEGHVRK